jgi:hypothetical protein
MAIKKKGKKQAGGGWLEKIGIKAEKLPTEDEHKRAERHATIERVWKYLRDRIDRGAIEYFRTGSTDILREFVGRPALDSMLEELERLRNAGVYWVQPDRGARTNPRYAIISEKLNKNNQPERFVIQERFVDHSVLRAVDGNAEKACEGVERVIQATVEVKGGRDFKLLSVIQVKGATL